MRKAEGTTTGIATRWQALIECLKNGPQHRAAILAALSDFYLQNDSGRRSLQRDVQNLNQLGISIEYQKAGQLYTLRGGTPHFDADDARLLALIRDSFGNQHPQAQTMRELLARLTAALTPEVQQVYQRRQSIHAPLDPAVDYEPFTEQIALLDSAISGQRLIEFYYQRPSREPILHPRVEPQMIEFYDRHYYLVGYSFKTHEFYDFRLDRISEIRLLESQPAHLFHTRALTPFRYRLDAMIATGGMSQRFEEQEIIAREPDGSLIINAKGRSDFFIIRMLLKYGAGAELLEPAWLRQQMRLEIEQLAKRYEGEVEI